MDKVYLYTLALIFVLILYVIVFSPIGEQFTSSAGGVFQQLASTSSNPYIDSNALNREINLYN